jgi:peptidyl-prolyl cis-trans isomerase D
MLDFMRKHAGTWMIKALLFAIVVVFVFWGVGSWTSRQEGVVATVNGEAISLEAYRTSYNQLLDQVRQSFGANLNDDLLKSLNLQTRALDQLIDRTLMKQAAARLKMDVNDEELAQSVRRIPAFQSNGAFDRRRYQQVLSVNRMTPEAFEASQRENLLAAKLMRVVTESSKVSDTEAEEWYKWNNAAVKFDLACVDADRYKNISPSTEEIAQFYERTKESYRTEPAIQVRYVHVSPEMFTGAVAVTEQELRDFYDANSERFVVPKTVEARHILIRLPADAPPEAVEKAQGKIQDILKMAREGKDFAELAKQYSEDEGSKAQGGALGAFPKEAMIQPFADVAFALPPGQISDPVRTRFGLHLIQVEKVNDGRTRGFEEAKADIQSQLTRERARTKAYDEAEAVYDAATAGGDLTAAAADRKLGIKTTDFFTRAGSVKGISQPEPFIQAAFQLAPGDVSEVLDLEDGYYLLQVAESRPSRIPELSAVEAAVRQDLIKERQGEMARKDAEALLADVKAGVGFEQAVKKIGVSRRTSDFIKRSDPVAGLGSEPEINRVAFGLSEGQPLAADPVKTAKGYCVLRFIGQKEPAMEGFEAERSQIKERLLQQKQLKIWESWMSQLRNSSQIERKKDFNRI